MEREMASLFATALIVSRCMLQVQQELGDLSGCTRASKRLLGTCQVGEAEK